MTTTKSIEPKFEQITLEINTNVKPRLVTAKTIPGCGLAYHDRLIAIGCKQSKYPITVTHIASGMSVENFRLRKHAEAFIREAVKIVDFTLAKDDLFAAMKSNDGYATMRRVYASIDSGSFFKGTKP